MASIPVFHQFTFVQRCPFDHEGMSAARELPVDHIQSEDIVLRFVLAVEGMKVRWRMIVPIHPNENSEEFADGWHMGVFSFIAVSYSPLETRG